MFSALNKLKADGVVDKLLDTTSTANYSNRTHRIQKSTHEKHVVTIITIYYYYYKTPGSLPVQAKNVYCI